MASKVRLLTDGDIGSRTSGMGMGNSSRVMWMKVIELDIPRHEVPQQAPPEPRPPPRSSPEKFVAQHASVVVCKLS